MLVCKLFYDGIVQNSHVTSLNLIHLGSIAPPDVTHNTLQ